MSWADKAIDDMKASYEAEIGSLRDRIEELVVERAVRLVNEDRYFFLKAEAAESKLAEARAEALEEAANVAEEYEDGLSEYPNDDSRHFYEGGVNDASLGIANRIRALKLGGANG